MMSMYWVIQMKIDRQAVYEKWGGVCAYCGKVIEFKDMQVDHLIPKRKGGTDDFDNLMPSCRRCNHYKSSLDLEQFRDMINKIPVKLMEREYIFKVGVDYGFFDPKQRNIKFYFEQQEEWEKEWGEK